MEIILIALLSGFIMYQQYLIRQLKYKAQMLDKSKKLIYSVGEKISNINNMEEVYSIILDAALELIPNAQKGSILLLEEDGKYHYRGLKGYPNDLKRLTLEKEETFLYKSNNFRETIVISNPLKFDEGLVEQKKVDTLKDYKALDISCCLTSPIYINEIPIGIMNIDTTISNYVFTKDDVALINHIKNELQLALKNSFTQQKLRHMSNFDELTGLYNRRYFRRLVSKKLEDIKKSNATACLVLIDLDNFKNINDSYGHCTGDQALKFFSNMLRTSINNDSIYARMSGDEFVILFNNYSEEETVEKMNSLRAKVSKTSFNDINIGFSYGICCIDKNFNLTFDDVFAISDKNMYKDKMSKCFRRG